MVGVAGLKIAKMVAKNFSIDPALLLARRKQVAARLSSLVEKHPAASALFFMVLIPSASFLLTLGELAPSRAIINTDYLILFCIHPLIPRYVTSFLLLIVVATDLTSFVSSMYHFSLSELAMSISYGTSIMVGKLGFPWERIAIFAILTSIPIAFCCRYKQTMSIRYATIGIFAFAFVLVGDVANGTATIPFLGKGAGTDRIQLLPFNIGTSGFLKSDLSFHRAPMEPAQSASNIALGVSSPSGFRRAAFLTKTNVAIVIVESWGSMKRNTAWEEYIISPMISADIVSKYEVGRGLVPFAGSTTYAEVRELCGLAGNYRNLSFQKNLDCIPEEFAAAGFHVTGLHGFSARMFDRRDWWPELGIKNGLFEGDLRRMGHARQCGTAFPGLCDEDVLRTAGDILAGEGRQFVYVLTLNSHLPLTKPDSAARAFCEASEGDLTDVQCALSVSWHRVFLSLSEIAVREHLPPTRFVVVGDHSPPWLSPNSASLYDQGLVPYIILTPRAPVGERRAAPKEAD